MTIEPKRPRTGYHCPTTCIARYRGECVMPCCRGIIKPTGKMITSKEVAATEYKKALLNQWLQGKRNKFS